MLRPLRPLLAHWLGAALMILSQSLTTATAHAQQPTRSLFQFMAFFDGDLEIGPGQTTTLNGRIHTNSDLYLNSETGTVLTIADAPAAGVMDAQVTAGGDIYRGRKNNTSCRGQVTIDALEDNLAPFDDLDPRVLSCVGETTSLVPPATWNNWHGALTAQAGSHYYTPDRGIIHRSSSYWRAADLRIALVLNQSGALPSIDVVRQAMCGLGNPTPPTLAHTIEVVDTNGLRDVAKTNLLWKFMTDLTASGTYCTGGAAASTPLVRPLFYTDVPLTNNTLAVPGATACNCSDSNYLGCGNKNVSCYPIQNNTRGIGTPTSSVSERVYTTNSFAGGMLNDLDYRRGGFFNMREHKWMYLLNLNLADLLLWNSSQPPEQRFFEPGDTSGGGILLYLTVIGPASWGVNNYGVRIFGSRDLYFPTAPGPAVDPTGITIVSDQAAYIQGDFNVGTEGGGSRAKQPVAVLADSINVLSNNYFSTTRAFANDAQSNRSLNDSERDATNTRINAALMGGVDPTVGGSFGGGLENYWRFHEDWAGKTFTYRGSLVSLGAPEHANGPWCGTGSGCNIYNAPTRNLNYDSSFEQIADLPPMSVVVFCGNGTVDQGEDCDDGNTANGDCCSSTCHFQPSTAQCWAVAGCAVATYCTGSSAECEICPMTVTPTVTATATQTATTTVTPTLTMMPTNSPTHSPTPTASSTNTPSETASPTITPTASPSLTVTVSPTPTATTTSTSTPTSTATLTPTTTPTRTPLPFCGDGKIDAGEECDDANPTNGDGCDANCRATGCGNEVAGTVCDDGDVCTLGDTCDGAGQCVGDNHIADYAVLRRHATVPTNIVGRATLSKLARVEGNTCSESVHLRGGAEICGDLVATRQSGVAVVIGPEARSNGLVYPVLVDGSLVVRGGSITRADRCHSSITCGTQTALGLCEVVSSAPANQLHLEPCAAANCAIEAKRSEVWGYPANITIPELRLVRGAEHTLLLPPSAAGNLQPTVIDILGNLRLGNKTILRLQREVGGGPVLVRTNGTLKLGRSARIELVGLAASDVLFVATKAVSLGFEAEVSGTILGDDRITLGRDAKVQGALLAAKDIKLGSRATLKRAPYLGW